MARTRKYMHGRRRRCSPLKKDKEIKDNIGFDEKYNIYYDKDIQKSYEQRRGRFAIPKTKEEKENKNKDRLV